MAREWLRSLEVRRYASATYNDKLHLLKGFFERIGHEAGVMKNPFSGCPTKIKKTMHRQPFTQDELNAILTHCDELTRPVVMTAMCTAMRRGDCSMLKWESVDLENGFISVKTSKTGELAEIPLFPLLRAELEKLPRVSEYVFPKVAAMYTENIHGLSWRFKQALKVAGIKGTVIAREDARHKASVKDFHSLRTTWITMALSAGVPMELVRRVTGHSTVEVVLKHYFRPGREAFRTALETAMPHMLTGGATPAKAIQAGQVLAQEARTLSHEELTKKVEGLAAVIAA
jgi:integrase